MTEDEVKARVERIRDMADDFEVAHGWEDDLWRDVLMVIAEGALSINEASALAREALKTREIKFARYCA